jgi:AGZA family xanthine/uracil permease-like MFS transporter
MGLNAYFTYQVVGYHGTGPVPYRLALTAVFVEGFIFVFLSLIGMRQWLVKLIPASLKVASTAGIGLFLTLIGLSTSAGIGLISGAESTPLDISGCLPKYQDEFGVCTSHKLQNPTVGLSSSSGGLCSIPTRLTPWVGLDWHILRRYHNCFTHDVQSEIRHDHRNRARLNPILA